MLKQEYKNKRGKIIEIDVKEHYQGTERCRVNRTDTRGETRWKVSRLEAVSLSNTRGSSNSSYTRYIINSMYVYWMYYIKH